MLKKIIILFLSFILLSISFYTVKSNEIINNIKRPIFRITGLGLLLLWIIIIYKNDVKDFTILSLSIMTLLWQFYGHYNKFLLNNLTTENKDTKAFYLGLNILSHFSILYEKTNIKNLFLLLFLLEQRYRSGEIVKL